MANSILTIDMITRKALEILENNLVLTRNVNRQYDDSFAVEGAKIGSTLRIRKPDRALVTDGAALQVQDENQQYTTLTVSSQKHIGVNFTSAELTMQLDDFAELILKPRVSQLAASVDADVANAYKSIYGSVGTPGTTPATSLVLLQAQQKLNEMATPMSPRYATVNPAANAGLVEGMKGFFNPTGTISKQFANGMMSTGVLGYDEINMSQSVVNHTTGTWGTTITSTSTVATQGQATLDISFTGSGKTWKQGDVFTIANVYAVNPQTRQSTGSLQQFVVTADCDHHRYSGNLPSDLHRCACTGYSGLVSRRHSRCDDVGYCYDRLRAELDLSQGRDHDGYCRSVAAPGCGHGFASSSQRYLDAYRASVRHQQRPDALPYRRTLRLLGDSSRNGLPYVGISRWGFGPVYLKLT